jgi:hypothetical protein
MTAADLDESLEAAPRLSARQLRAELEQFRSCPNVGVPPFIRYAFDGDREATLSLCRTTRNLFATVLEPYWPDIRANHHSELVRRGRLVADRDVRTALTATIPGSQWSGDCLEIDTPRERTVCLGGRGVVLTPVVFWTGPWLVGELGDQPVVLAYPAPAGLTFRVGNESNTLAAVLGSTRAAVLRCWPMNTPPATLRKPSVSVQRRRPNTPRRCGRLAWWTAAATAKPSSTTPPVDEHPEMWDRRARTPAARWRTIAQRCRRVAVSGQRVAGRDGSWFRMS